MYSAVSIFRGEPPADDVPASSRRVSAARSSAATSSAVQGLSFPLTGELSSRSLTSEDCTEDIAIPGEAEHLYESPRSERRVCLCGADEERADVEAAAADGGGGGDGRGRPDIDTLETEEGCRGAVAERDAFAHRPDIDGLRAVAVLAVVAFHVDSKWLPGGFTGVDVFFVISGYVVTGSLLRRPSHTAGDFVAGFYARRAKRLLPSFFAMSVLTVLVLAAFVPPWMPELNGYYLSAAFASVGVSNLHFASLGGDGYFDDGNGQAGLKRNPFTHTWSLAVEEQFYFIHPFLVILLYGPRAVTKSPCQQGCFRPTTVFIFCASCSLIVAALLTEYWSTVAFFVLPSRFWELACGAILFDLQAFNPEFLRLVELHRNRLALEVAAMVLLALAFAITTEDHGFPFPGTLLPVCGACCFILAGLSQDALLNRCLGCWLPVYVGKLSYPIYLWHWPVLVLARWILDGETLRACWSLLALLTAVVVLAMLCYHVLEAPFRELQPRRFGFAFFVTVSVIGCSELCIFSVRGQFGEQIYGAINPVRVRTENETTHPQLNRSSRRPAVGADMCRCTATLDALHAPPDAQGDTLIDSIAGTEVPCFESAPPPETIPPHFMRPGELPCFISFASEAYTTRATMESCLQIDRGADKSSRGLFLIGDSHAQHWKPALEAAVRGSFEIVSLTTGFPCEYSPAALRGYGILCDVFNSVISEALISTLRSGDLVVYGMMAKRLNEVRLNETPTLRHDYKAFLVRLKDQAAARNATLLIMADTVELPKSGRYCVPTLMDPDAPRGCEVPLAEAREYGATQLDVYHDVMAERPDTLVFESAPLYCEEASCGAFVPGTDTVAVWDTSHLTRAGSLYAWPFLCSFLLSSGVLP